MNISKLTISPFSKKQKPIRILSPSNEVLEQTMQRAVTTNSKLPLRLVKKITAENNVPSYINRACYSGSSTAIEDPRVLGGYFLSYYV